MGYPSGGPVIQPYFHISDGWLRQETASSPSVQIGPKCFLGMYHLTPLGGWGNPTGPFHGHPKRAFPGFSVESSTYIRLYFLFLESHSPLWPIPAWGPQVPVQGLALGAASTVAMGAWMGASFTPQHILLISCSNVWAASSTH